MGIEALVPAPLRNPYRRMRSYLKNRGLGGSNASIFGAIYAEGTWGRGEDGEAPFSGSGSYDPSVDSYVALVRRVIAEEGVRSVLEIGCGDFSVGSRYAGDVDRYLGVDVAPAVIAYHQQHHASGRIAFVQGDAAREDWGSFDLCIIRQVLQHLSNRDIAAILERTKMHRLLLVTEHLPAPDRLVRPNLDKSSGPDTRVTFGSGVYLDQPPYGLSGQVVMETPVADVQAHDGEIMRSLLIRRA